MKIASFDKVEWIDPRNDRCPMTDDAVLVTAETKDGHKVMFGWCERYKDMDIWHTSIEGRKVLAWMPLPDPYNPVEEEELLEDARNAAMDAVAEFLDSKDAEEVG